MSVALYLSGSDALRLDVESLVELLRFAFVLAGAVFAFRFAFELFVLVAGWQARKTTNQSDAITKSEMP
jgi:hypothetical protein